MAPTMLHQRINDFSALKMNESDSVMCLHPAVLQQVSVAEKANALSLSLLLKKVCDLTFDLC